MTLSYLLAAALIVLPLAWATWRRWTMHALLALAAACTLLAGGLLALLLTRTVNLVTYSDGAYHDSYYVVAHGHYIASLALIFVVLIPLHWAAHRFARPVTPRVLRASVWGLTLGLTGPSLLRWSVLFPPKRYTDFSDWSRTMIAIDQIGILLTALCLLTLVFLPLYTLLLRRKH